MTLRIMGALVLQPFVAAAAGFLAFPLVDAMNGFSLTNGAEAAISIAVGTGLVAFFVTVCGSLPIVAWLRDRGPVTFGQVMMGGVALGMIPVLVLWTLAIVSAGGPQLGGLLRGAIFATTVGTVSAGVFWLMAHRDLEAATAGGGDC